MVLSWIRNYRSNPASPVAVPVVPIIGRACRCQQDCFALFGYNAVVILDIYIILPAVNQAPDIRAMGVIVDIAVPYKCTAFTVEI